MFELLLITDPAAPRGLVGSVRAALEGGSSGRVAVQLRAKHLPPAELLPLARELRAVTRRRGALFFVNEHIDIARASGADGVHLPEAGPQPSAARAQLGPSALIGASCHDPAGLDRAASGGADFATLSPVFESPNKGEPLGLDRFTDWVRATRLPVFALGGIRAEHTRALKCAGASGVAVISAVFQAPDPAAAVRALLA